MSIYIPVDREPIYRKFGLEEALVDPVYQQGEVVDLMDRRDGFGHNVVMLWVKGEEGVRISVEEVEVRAEGAVAQDAFNHHLPFIHHKLGEGALAFLTQEQQETVEAA